MKNIVLVLGILAIINLFFIVYNKNTKEFDDSWRKKVSKRPYNDYMGIKWIVKSLHLLEEVDKKYLPTWSRTPHTVFNIKGTDYYVIYK